MNTVTTLVIVRLLLSFVASIAVFIALIFWPAGTIDWQAGWLYVGLLIASFVVNILYLARVNPELIEHRMRIGPGTKRWDKVLMVVFSPLVLAIYVIAGLDAVRYEWSTMSPSFWLVGLAIFVPGTAVFVWSMGVNPFFEKTVRIQTERGHRVIDSGPYRFVRHPGYLGFFGWMLSVPLLLGSWWAFVPAVLSSLAIVLRTALEDGVLRRELPGYDAYASRVRYRLIPGVW